MTRKEHKLYTKPCVGDVWYRWEASFAPFDEAPDFAVGNNPNLVHDSAVLLRAYVHKCTPNGVWLHPNKPVNFIGQEDYRTNRKQGAWWQEVRSYGHFTGNPLWWATSKQGRFKPTTQQAWDSFRIRCQHRLAIAEHQLTMAKRAMEVAEQPMPAVQSELAEMGAER